MLEMNILQLKYNQKNNSEIYVSKSQRRTFIQSTSATSLKFKIFSVLGPESNSTKLANRLGILKSNSLDFGGRENLLLMSVSLLCQRHLKTLLGEASFKKAI